ncbi:15985_t:CDS:2 [Gigaspora margarita]|uniref:15985_t:CDS:1 n=2 Tax=Gigaspora margarita TaxID=4874 RepID=A0ABN7VFV1_GIGMA|nr:hypothetical protein F8M41_026245 [Gigaspora margarita]CAG8761172.1 15985_t:CDS:2 [Gigaspora margarita]
MVSKFLFFVLALIAIIATPIFSAPLVEIATSKVQNTHGGSVLNGAADCLSQGATCPTANSTCCSGLPCTPVGAANGDNVYRCPIV